MKQVYFVLSLFLFAACQKSSIEHDMTDKSAKKQLENTVQLKEVKNSIGDQFTTEPKIRLKFNSFKEAVDFFKYQTQRQPQIINDTLKRVPETKLLMSESSYASNSYGNVHYVNYYGPITSTSNLALSFGAAGAALAHYFVDAQIGYGYNLVNEEREYTSKSFISNTATTPSVLFQGAGTVTATAEFYSFTHDSGYYTGAMQGVMTIAGTSYSFVFSLTGYYHIQPPSSNEPAPTLIITHSLQARNPFA